MHQFSYILECTFFKYIIFEVHTSVRIVRTFHIRRRCVVEYKLPRCKSLKASDSVAQIMKILA